MQGTHPPAPTDLTLPPFGPHLLRRPNATWSPGGAPGGGAPQNLALKRAENWLGSVAVPVGVLAVKSPTASLYATQLSFLKDQSAAVYYYSSPINNGATQQQQVAGRSLLRAPFWVAMAAPCHALPACRPGPTSA